MNQKITFAYYISTYETAEEGVHSPTNNGVNPHGMIGNLEYLLNVLQNPKTKEERKFARNYELAVILVDVRTSRFNGTDPFNLEELGRKLGIPVYVINSDHVRKAGISDEERANRKAVAEQRILNIIERYDVDILCLDRAMIKIESTILNNYRHRVFNIHPANTLDLELRGSTPTINALKRAREGGKQRTGATLHEVNEKFDDGPQVYMEEGTPIDLNRHTSPEALRADNYNCEHRVFIIGMNKLLSHTGVQVTEVAKDEHENILRNEDGSIQIKTFTRNYWNIILNARAERHNRLNSVANIEESFTTLKKRALEEVRRHPVPVLAPVLARDSTKIKSS